MKSTKISVLCAGVAFLPCFVLATVISDFEAPAYSPGGDTSLNGMLANGWATGGAGGIIYPSTGVPLPTYTPLVGDQSVYVYSATWSHDWGAGASAVGDGATVSYNVRTEVNAGAGETWFFVSHSLPGSTPAGIIMRESDDEVFLLGANGGATANYLPTGFNYTNFKNYKFEMILDFTNDRFDAYVTNVSDVGPRTFLGTQDFTTDLDPVDTATNGGIIMGNWGGGTASMWDQFEIVPEPASLALFALGGLLAARLRRR